MADQRRARRRNLRRGQGPQPAGASRRARAALIGSAGDTAVRGEDSPKVSTPSASPRPRRRLRPRLTGRAAILTLVIAVLVVSYASSLKAYLQQRHDILALQSEITSRQRSIDDLQAQKDRWQDPAYVKQQARARFGYVMPGETSYIALDSHGKRVQSTSQLGSPKRVGVSRAPTAWWTDAWGSVELAGQPPAQDTRGPATMINGAKHRTGHEE